MTNAPVYTNGQWVITLPAGANSARFYRLQADDGPGVHICRYAEALASGCGAVLTTSAA